MKMQLAALGAAVLGLSGCVAYDDGYRTTGRVGEYGTYRGDGVYSQSRTRVVEDRAGNIYRVYPDGTAVLIGRSGYPYGYGGYSNAPYGYGSYGSYPYGSGRYGGSVYGYGGYSSYPYGYGGYARPHGSYPVRPGHPVPVRPRPPAPHTGSVTPPVVVDRTPPPPAFTPRAESPTVQAERAEARRESRRSRELQATDP